MSGVFLILLGGLSPLVPFFLYFAGNFYGMTEPYSLSMIFGIFAYGYFMNALILSSRLTVLDRLLGHDRVLRVHRGTAAAALGLGLLHAAVKSSVYAPVNGQTALGAGALALFLALGLTALLVMAPFRFLRIPVPKKTNYTLLKKIHNGLGAAGILAAFHVLGAGSTYETLPRSIVMGAWAGAAVLLWGRHKLIRPLVLRRRGQRVLGVKQLNGDTVEIRFSKGKFHAYEAGQFAFVKFIGSGIPAEEHPFTLSSSPDDPDLRITVKALGDYTSSLSELETGTSVLVDGPYGRMVPNSHPGVPVVMIAGGIGITPFVSMSRSLARIPGKQTVLLWSVRTPGDLVYLDELQRTAEKSSDFRFIPTCTRSSGGGDHRIRTGRLTRSSFEENLSEDLRILADFFICGPSDFIQTVSGELKALGIGRRRIHFERFSF